MSHMKNILPFLGISPLFFGDFGIVLNSRFPLVSIDFFSFVFVAPSPIIRGGIDAVTPARAPYGARWRFRALVIKAMM